MLKLHMLSATLIVGGEVYTDEVDVVSHAAQTVSAETPGAALMGWLQRFFAFFITKRQVASQLLRHTDDSNPVFGESRAGVIAAGRPLLVAAQHAHEVRDDLTREQILDTIIRDCQDPR